jgi:hypothetical protein
VLGSFELIGQFTTEPYIGLTILAQLPSSTISCTGPRADYPLAPDRTAPIAHIVLSAVGTILDDHLVEFLLGNDFLSSLLVISAIDFHLAFRTR